MLSAMSLASANEVITFNHSRQRLWTIYIGVTLCTTRGTQAPVWVPSDATSLPGRSGARTRESGASGGCPLGRPGGACYRRFSAATTTK
jgi:hypothetical protein